MCLDCGRKLEVCTKCCQAKELVAAVPDDREQKKLDGELQNLLQTLPERKRRSFLRYLNKQNSGEVNKEDLQNKLAALQVNSDDEEESETE